MTADTVLQFSTVNLGCDYSGVIGRAREGCSTLAAVNALLRRIWFSRSIRKQDASLSRTDAIW